MSEHSDFRKYAVAPDVVAGARKLGLFGNVEAKIADMARRSANITHPDGNRRFHGFVMQISNGVVVALKRFNPKTGETKDDIMTELSERERRRRKTLQAIEKHFGKSD